MNRLSLIVLSLASFLLTIEFALAGDFDRRQPGFPHQPPSINGDFLYQPLNQFYVGNNTLRLRQILNIGPEYRGRQVEYVVLRARTDRGRAFATLLVNQQPVGYGQDIGPQGGENRFSLDRFNNTIDEQIQSLQLQLQGQVYIEGVGVMLSRGYYPPPGRPSQEMAVIQQNFQGNIGLQIARYVDMSRHHGRTLRGVTVRASTAHGMGRAAFCANRGCTNYVQVGTYLNDIHFTLYGEIVDQYASNWHIALQGNFWIDSIVLHFNP